MRANFSRLSQIKGLPETEDDFAKLIRLSKKVVELLEVIEKKIKRKVLTIKIY